VALCDDVNFEFHLKLKSNWKLLRKKSKRNSQTSRQTQLSTYNEKKTSENFPFKHPNWTLKASKWQKQINATRSLATACQRDNFLPLHRLAHLREIEQYCFYHLRSWSRAQRRTSMWSCSGVMFATWESLTLNVIMLDLGWI
jgi:hypothetical protein